MPGFEVRHAYRSSRDGQQFGPWLPGDVVELTESDAEWVCRDSPGALLPAGAVIEDGEPDAEPARAKPPAANRQARPGRNR